METELVFSCAGKNGVYFMLCSWSFVEHAQFSHFMLRNATAVYMDFVTY
jgi:hypothetical protein